jgi:hypothetical protein
MTRQTAMRRKIARQLADGKYSDAARTSWHELSEVLDKAADRAHEMADKVSGEAQDRFSSWQDTNRRRAKEVSADARKLAKEYRKEGRKVAAAAREEGMWRARATRDALAGRRQRRMPWVLSAAAAGIAAGMAAGYYVRRLWVGRSQQQELTAADDVIALDAGGGPVVGLDRPATATTPPTSTSLGTGMRSVPTDTPASATPLTPTPPPASPAPGTTPTTATRPTPAALAKQPPSPPPSGARNGTPSTPPAR